MDNYLFDYSAYFKRLKEHPIKPEERETALKYEKLYGSQEGLTLRDQPFYKDYLSLFKIPFQVSIPVDVQEDFDWDMLIRLILGSFSSRYSLELEDEWRQNPGVIPMIQLLITANSGEKDICKSLDELYSFQVIRLFEIYVNEQLDLAILKEEEEEGLIFHREEKLKLYKKKSFMIFREVKTYLTLIEMIPSLQP